MFKLFNKVSDYNHLANTINKMNILLNEMYVKISLASNPNSYKSKIYSIAFLMCRDIIEKTKEGNWDMNGKIFIKSLSNRNITLGAAQEAIDQRLSQICDLCDPHIQKTVSNILAKGDFYYWIEINRKTKSKN